MSPAESIGGGNSDDGSIRSVAGSAAASARTIVLLRLGSLGLALLGAVILSRTLGPDGRGIHAFFVGLTVLLVSAVGLGAPTGAYVLSTVHSAPFRQLAVNGLWLAAASGVCATALVVAANYVVPFLPKGLQAIPAWPAMIAIAVGGFAANAHQLLLALASGRAILGAALSFGPYSIAAVGYLVLPLTSGGLEAAIWTFVLAPYLTALASLVPNGPRLVAVGRPRPGLMSRSIKQGLRTYPGELAALLNQRADVVILGIVGTQIAVGTYVVAYQTVEPILALGSAGAATIMSLRLGAEVERGDVVERLIREALLLGGLASLVVGALAPVLVPIIYGSEFSASVLPLLILLPGIVGLTIGRIAISDLTRRNLLERQAGILTFAAAVNLMLNLVLAPILGATGAALASLGSYSILAILALTIQVRIGGLRLRAVLPGRADLRSIGQGVRASFGMAMRRP